MTDHELLEDPSGAPYPESVQRLARAIDLAELGPYVLESGREALVHALEAAIAADREHRPAKPELDDETRSLLVNLYLSGMVAGSATTLIQADPNHEQAKTIALALVTAMADDPAVRFDMEDMVARYWRNPPDSPEWQSFTAHLPRNHRDD